jgi:hypothetical protein
METTEFEYTTKKEAEAYLEEHNASGFEPGDIVKITRAAKDGENGWENGWNEVMDSHVGQYGVIADDAKENGFQILTKETGKTMGLFRPYCFPYFILEKVKLNGDE